jgi:carboxy-cis,cis-muconate cyclase
MRNTCKLFLLPRVPKIIIPHTTCTVYICIFITLPMETQHVLGYPSINDTYTPVIPIIYILSGSFRSLSLFLLAFSPSNRSLSHLQTVPAFGPHQYLACNDYKDRVYTTSWANPPSLSSWHIERSGDGSRSVSHINTVPISLCFNITPRCY